MTVGAFVTAGSATMLVVPDRLYHGTTTLRLEAILKDGLRDDRPRESMLSDAAVYLAADASLAAAVARRRSARHGGDPLVVSVASCDLDPGLLRLDMNLAGGRYWSRSLVHWGGIPAAVIDVERWDDLAHLKAWSDSEDPETGDGGIAFDPVWDRAWEFMPRVPGLP